MTITTQTLTMGQIWELYRTSQDANVVRAAVIACGSGRNAGGVLSRQPEPSEADEKQAEVILAAAWDAREALTGGLPGVLTDAQLDGMDMWDRDPEVFHDRMRAVWAMLVRMAVAEIRRSRSQFALNDPDRSMLLEVRHLVAERHRDDGNWAHEIALLDRLLGANP